MPGRKKEPAVPETALEFCQRVSVWQNNPAGTAGLSIDLTPTEEQLLRGIVDRYVRQGSSAALEADAYRFLRSYRVHDNEFAQLPTDDRERLDTILAVEPKREETSYRMAPSRHQLRLPGINLPRRVIVAAVAVIAVVVGGVVLAPTIEHWGGTSPPPGIVQEHPPAPVVLPGTSNLQQLKDNFGPWQQLTPSDQQPQTGQPALLLLEDGGYFASASWTVKPNSSGWQQDIAGNVDNVDVKGNYADITDSDGNPYLVGINQPFIVSSNPGTVLRIDPTGNVFAMTTAQATAVRQPLDK